MLDKYLNDLAKTAEVQRETRRHVETLDIQDLARIVGVDEVKLAGDMPPFLEQDRPAKVKEIYSALKRDHPDMPAEVKARIASRKGKASPKSRKPPSSGGPKYKAPLNFKRKGESYVKKAASTKTAGKSDIRTAPRSKLPNAASFDRKSSAPKSSMKNGKLKKAEDPGWWEQQKGMSRAMRETGEGKRNVLLANPELIGNRVTSGLLGSLAGAGTGAAVGAGSGLLASLISRGKIRPGAGAGLGALGGGLLGGGVGQTVGQMSADKKYLKSRGITPGWGAGIGGAQFTPEAAAKYLDKSSSAKYQEKVASALVQLIEACKGDPVKVASALEAQGIKKEAIMPILNALGRSAKRFGQVITGKGTTLGQAAERSGRDLSRSTQHMGGRIAEAYRGGQAASRTAGGKGGIMSGLGGVISKEPGAAAAMAAVPVATGAAGYKMGSALFEVGDAAGRVLAKTAAMGMPPVSPEELQESIEEAQGREDIPGRAKAWQIGGGVGGGLLGAAPGALLAGLSKQPKFRALGAGLGLAGGAGGAALGQHLGYGHGEEEAGADKAISMLRALRAHNMGAQMGAQHGYMAGLQQGMGGEDQKTAAGMFQSAVKTVAEKLPWTKTHMKGLIKSEEAGTLAARRAGSKALPLKPTYPRYAT